MVSLPYECAFTRIPGRGGTQVDECNVLQCNAMQSSTFVSFFSFIILKCQGNYGYDSTQVSEIQANSRKIIFPSFNWNIPS